MEQQLAFMTDLTAGEEGLRRRQVLRSRPTKEVRLPQHGSLAGYEQNIEWNIHRYCGFWGRGI